MVASESTPDHPRFERGDTVDTKIEKVRMALVLKGRQTPTRFEDLGLPEREHAALYANRLKLRKFSNYRSTTVAAAVTRPGEAQGSFPFGAAATFVAAIVLAISMSLWWLLAILFVPVLVVGWSSGLAQRYDAKLLREAMASEAAFCLLYAIREISVMTPDGRTEWYWDKS
jgi:hypothetical protein